MIKNLMHISGSSSLLNYKLQITQMIITNYNYSKLPNY